MVTPASIFEALATPDMVDSQMDAEELAAAEEEGDASTFEAGDVEEPATREAEARSPQEAKDIASMESFGTHLKGLHGTNYFVMEMTKSARKKEVTKKAPKTPLWLPLTFPDIPKKGNFDVTKLRGSKYFFS